VDIGGTFTDCVLVQSNGEVAVGKSPTVHEEPEQGVLNALEAAALKAGTTLQELLPRLTQVVHGTTIGTNALIERAGARTGLITTKGHEDNLLIGRVYSKRAGLSEREITHVARLNKPQPIVPRQRIVGVAERVDFEGDIVAPLREDDVAQAADRLVAEGVEALAVCFLWSFRNPQHEQRAREIIAERHPGIPVTISSEISPILGEYERVVTTVLNAYLQPRISTYLGSLRARLSEGGYGHELMVIHSGGGITTVEEAARKAVWMIDSGPAGGTLGGRFFGEQIGHRNLICTDVGGTSFDVSLVYEGELQLESEPVIGQYVYRAPKILIKSIGAGGGSIVWLDDLGVMHVGPKSARSVPGPACYSRGGTEPTVTDADLILGYLNPDNFLGGEMRLDRGRAEAALAPIAERLGMSLLETAYGVFQITNAHMADLIRRMTIEQGHDPRDFAVVAYGGAGAVHAVGYSADIEAKALYVPSEASVFSAFGMLCADVVHTVQASHPMRTPLEPQGYEEINRVFGQLTGELLDTFDRQGIARDDVELRRFIHMRYQAQVHELPVEVPVRDLSAEDEQELAKAFLDRYTAIYGEGAAFAAAGHEFLTFGVEGRKESTKPSLARAAASSSSNGAGGSSTRAMYFGPEHGTVQGAVYDGAQLHPGDTFEGPAVVERFGDAVVVPPGSSARIDELENIVISIQSRGGA
jgi:N-methylhydantoinase A